jgi:hypothetical protein
MEPPVLPPELWLKVLAHLPTEALVAAGTASRLLCTLSRDWTLWKDRWAAPRTWSSQAAAAYNRLIGRLGRPDWQPRDGVRFWTVAQFMDGGGRVDALSLTPEALLGLQPLVGPEFRRVRFRRLLAECRHLVLDGDLTRATMSRMVTWSTMPLCFPNVERVACAVSNVDDNTLSWLTFFLVTAFPSPTVAIGLHVRLRKGTLSTGLDALAAVPAITSLQYRSREGIAADVLHRVLASLPNLTALDVAVAMPRAVARVTDVPSDGVALDGEAWIGRYGDVLTGAPLLASVAVVVVLPDRRPRLSAVHAACWDDVGRRCRAAGAVRFRLDVVAKSALVA